MPKFTLSAASLFDLGLAALAAVSAGFVTFAMPEPVFSGLIASTPLPDFLAAARPPLGDTARAVAVGAAGLFVFAFVWSLLAAIDRLPRRRSELLAADEDAPVLRAADSHPDAPSRRPIAAGRELGEPLLLDAPLEAPVMEEVAEAPVAEPEPVVEAEPAPEPEALAELAARLPEAQGAPEASLSEMVHRIEHGFGRKRQAIERPAEPEPEPAPPPAVEEEKVGHRLRSAISELQKISAQA